MALMRGLIGEAMVLVTRQEWETKQVDYVGGNMEKESKNKLIWEC